MIGALFAFAFSLLPMVALAMAYKLYVDYINPAEYIAPSSDRTVVISGCDSGFGEKLALQLTKKGYTVFAGCLTEKGCEALKASSGNAQNLHAQPLNICKQEDVDKFAQYVTGETGGKLSALVNNAGIGSHNFVDWETMDMYRRVMDVNYFGHIAMTKALMPLLMRYTVPHQDKKPQRGRIITIASVAGFLGAPGLSAYNGSKFAVEGWMDAMRREMWQWNMPVVIIEPGYMKTAILQGLGFATEDKIWSSLSEKQRKRWGDDFRKRQLKDQSTGLMSWAEEPSLVIDALEDAVSRLHPPVRYMVGYFARFVFRITQFAPAWISDYTVRLIEGPSMLPAGVKDPSLIEV